MNKVVVMCNKEHEKGYEDYTGVCLLCKVEYHKDRAARWRAEAHKLIGHEIELPWVGLTSHEQSFVYDQVKHIVDGKAFWVRFADAIEAQLKEKNT